MNKVFYSLTGSFLLLVFIFFILKSLFISEYEKQINEVKANYTNKNLEFEHVQKAIQDLDCEINQNRDQAKLKFKKLLINWLFTGNEGQIISQIVNNASEANIIISRFSILQPIYLKTHDFLSQKSNSYEAPSYKETNQAISEQHQYSEATEHINTSLEDLSEQPDWQGIEFMPLSIETKGIYSNLALFFKKIYLNIPNYLIYSLNLNIDTDGLTKGQIVLLFPKFNKNKLARPIDFKQ